MESEENSEDLKSTQESEVIQKQNKKQEQKKQEIKQTKKSNKGKRFKNNKKKEEKLENSNSSIEAKTIAKETLEETSEKVLNETSNENLEKNLEENLSEVPEENSENTIKKADEQNEVSNKEEKNAKPKKKSKKGVIIGIIIVLLVIALGVGGYFAYLKFGPKFQDVSLELGTNEVTLEQFLRPNYSLDKAKMLTDLSTIDFTKASTYTISLEYDGVQQNATLTIVDTTPPVVEFQDSNQYLDYELNADDFIKSKTDLAQMTTSIVNPPEINGIGTYPVTVEVRDASNNVVSQTCELNITRVVKEYTLELGEKLEKKDVLLSIEEDADTIKQSDIDKINKSAVGEYELVSDLDGNQETIKIIVQDTKAPTLELKNVTIYDDEKIDGKSDFIKSCEDASDEVTTTLKTKIDYSKLGKQEIVIEAVDSYGNKTEKKATLTIKEDTEGPVFSGLYNISVKRNGSVNFKSGVKAVDAKDGTVSFTVDTSKVKLNVAGTYYAKYTAKDKKGNTTTKSRKITVEHNQEDTNNKFNSFYNKYLAGKSVSGIISEVRSRIKYNSSWGGDDPVWYGLTNYTGNCYVHAMIVKKALDKQGIKNQLIYVTDKSHYWNLVYQNGKWRHYDATPTDHIPGPATDKEKAASSAMRGRKWSSSFPKAE